MQELAHLSEQCEHKPGVFEIATYEALELNASHVLFGDADFWRCRTWIVYETLISSQRDYGLLIADFNAIHSDLMRQTAVTGVGLVLLLAAIWWLLRSLKIQQFMTDQIYRLNQAVMAEDADAVSDVVARLEGEQDRRRNPIYWFGWPVPRIAVNGLAGLFTIATQSREWIKQRLEPRQQLSLDAERGRLRLKERGASIKQDLAAERPRFAREMEKMQVEHTQERWKEVMREIGLLRQALIGAQAELAKNPAVEAQLDYTWTRLERLTGFLTDLRETGKLKEDDLSQAFDAMATRITQRHIEQVTGVDLGD